MSKFKFTSFTPESFAGINEENNQSLIITIPEDCHVIELAGDQGQCKTSALSFIKAMCGGSLPANAINSVDEDMRGTATFEEDGVVYTVRMTKSGFTVKFNDGTGLSTKGSPKEWLQSRIGNIGISPMSLKDKKGKDQIEWIREVYKLDKESLDLEKRILAGLKKVTEEKRPNANREYARLKKEVADTGYYFFDEDNKVFGTTEILTSDTALVDAVDLEDDSLTRKHEEAQKKVNQFNNAKTAIANYHNDAIRQNNRIDELKAQLAAAEEEHLNTQAQIKKAEDWFKNNQDPQSELDAALKLLKDSGELKAKKKNIASAATKLSEFLKAEEAKIMVEGEVEEYKNQQKEFVKATTPEVEGLEIIVGDYHQTKTEGVWYKDKPPAAWSESETWELYLRLCKALNIRVSIVENISSLGSSAINVINEFIESGGYIFCSRMDRSKKGIEIIFNHKYPV